MADVYPQRLNEYNDQIWNFEFVMTWGIDIYVAPNIHQMITGFREPFRYR